MNDEYLWCFKRESNRRERQDLTEEQNRIGTQEHGESEEKCKEILLRDLVGLFQEQFFVARKKKLVLRAVQKDFFFPPKNLEKYRCL